MAGILARWRRWQKDPLLHAFLLSIVFHVELVCLVEIGNYRGWWTASLLPGWLRQPKPSLAAKPMEAPVEPQDLVFRQPPQDEEPPLLYVEVDPSLATIESPAEAQYYSARNSLAANPEPDMDAPTPKVDGNQTKIVKTVDTLRPNSKPFNQPNPAPAPAPKKVEDPAVQPKPEEKPPEKPEPTPELSREPLVAEGKPQTEVLPGDTQVGSPQKKQAPPKPPQQLASATPPPRRRTLPPEKRQMGMLAGEKMQQTGGVRRRGLVSSLDVKESPFGNYDEQIIIAIQQRWFALLDQQDFVREHVGKVVLEFQMTDDGRVTNMRVSECDASVGDLLAIVCQRAVLDPVPYAPWPKEMRRKIGAKYRDVRFTFYYE